MKHRFITLVGVVSLLFAAFITLPEPIAAAGNTYYVSMTGNDSNSGTLAQPWLTPQHALKTAVAGDTVYFRAGSYSSLDLTCANSGSSAAGYITYQNYPGETVDITAGGSACYRSGLDTNSKSYLQFIGLNFKGNSNTYYGIFIHQSDHVTIRNCTMTVTVSSGIQAALSTYVTIDGCSVYNTNSGYAEECISIVTCNNFEIKNCKVHDPASLQRLGIDMKVGCTNGSVHDNEVYNLSGMWNGGIYIDAQGTDSHDIQIYNNMVHDIPLGGGFSIGDELAATTPGHIYNINVYNNIAYNCGQEGLIITQRGAETFTDINIINNTFYDCTSYSAYSPVLNMYQLNPVYANHIIIRNNIGYSKNAYAIPIFDPLHCYAGGKLLADHNFWYNPAGWYVDSTSVKGTNTIEADPMFVNAPFNLCIQSCSPAKDTGFNVALPATDYIGTARPQGAGTDIGAYECSSVTPTETMAISSDSLPNGIIGTAYSQTLAATGGTAPYTWSISTGTLPAGLSLNSSGAISGTPAAAVSSVSITFRVTDSTTSATTKTLPITINNSLPTIFTGSLTNGTAGTAYRQTLTAAGGVAPYTWSISTGTLPAGLSLNSSGAISGTPAAAVSSVSITFRVTDSTTSATTKTLPITINNSLPTIFTGSLTNGTAGTAYRQTLTAAGGVAPYTWSISTGTLPAGLSLNSSGAISGTPAAAVSSVAITFRVTDSTTSATTKTLLITINNSLPTISTGSLTSGTAGTAYRQTLTAAGGVAPYTWSIASGTLPAGLSLSSSGVISGTPAAAAGPLSVTFRVTDSTSAAATKSISFTVNAARFKRYSGH